MKNLISFIAIITLGLTGLKAQGIYKGGVGGGFAWGTGTTLTLGRSGDQYQTQSTLQLQTLQEGFQLINRSGQTLQLHVMDIQGRRLQTLSIAADEQPQAFNPSLPAGTYLLVADNEMLAGKTLRWIKY